jgi:hypothetical protein
LGNRRAAACLDAQIRSEAIHLRCDFAQGGTVTIEGRFLTRFATSRPDAAVLSAVVTVRSASGETLYSARDAFTWKPVE